MDKKNKNKDKKWHRKKIMTSEENKENNFKLQKLKIKMKKIEGK